MTAVFDAVRVTGAYGQSPVQKTIPDNNPQGLTHEINPANAGGVGRAFNPIGLVEVFLGRITHPRPSDLTVTLISPAGTQTVLFDRAAVSGNVLEFDNMLLKTSPARTRMADGGW